jgi:hypothetical protein
MIPHYRLPLYAMQRLLSCKYDIVLLWQFYGITLLSMDSFCGVVS